MQGLYQTVATRLGDGRCPALLQAGTALDGAAAIETLALSAQLSSALVFPLEDAAVPVKEAGLAVTQAEAWSFGVMLGLVYPGGLEQFEPARDEIKAALRGWTPAGCSRPVQYMGGRLFNYAIDKDGGRLLWLLRFGTTVQETYGVQT